MILFATGCASVDAHFPVARMDSPETNGQDRIVRLSAGLTPVHELHVGSDAGDRPFSTDGEHITTFLSAMFFGSFAVSDRIDLGVRTTAAKAPVMATAKYQIIGEPAAKAKQGNFSLAVTGSLGYWDEKKNGEQKDLFGEGDYPWTLAITSRTMDTSLIAGYRFRDRVLFYGSLFYTNYDIDVAIEHRRSSNGDSPAASYALDYAGYQRGVNLGMAVDLNDFLQLMFEALVTDIYLGGRLHNGVKSGAANVVFVF